MNRVINNPDMVVEDMLQGWLLAHDNNVRIHTENPRVVQRVQAPEAGKVGVITGGGSGHEPAFLGYTGTGMLDAVAIGEIFSSPTANSFLDAMHAANGGAGVACLYGNYAGDNMNVKMAVERAAQEGLDVQTVVANDDVASAPKGDEANRRGVAGEIFMWKVGAAKAAQGGSLEEVIQLAQKAIDNTRSIGIGLSACVIPAVGKANFTIEHGTMEVGIGHHGEPGVEVSATVSAAEMADIMLDRILPDLPFNAGQTVAVLVSGLGATPVMEQYILYGEIHKRLSAKGLKVTFKQVGNLFTSLEMMGVTLTIMQLDDELEVCLLQPCESVGLTVPGSAIEFDRRAASTSGQGASAGQQSVSQGNKNSAAQSQIQTAKPASAGHATSNADAALVARSTTGPTIDTATAGDLVHALVATIVANRDYLSEIDGLIGDGDHGINMAKGFSGCADRLDKLGDAAHPVSAALTQLSQALMDDIGGSMGPLYGKFFAGLADTISTHPKLDADLFEDALRTAVTNVQSMGNAKRGDKTLMDTLLPALDAFQASNGNKEGFACALTAMSEAAEKGRDATKNMQARIGRSARLGERSIGVLDAGATSCCLILQSIATSLTETLES